MNQQLKSTLLALLPGAALLIAGCALQSAHSTPGGPLPVPFGGDPTDTWKPVPKMLTIGLTGLFSAETGESPNQNANLDWWVAETHFNQGAGNDSLVFKKLTDRTKFGGLQSSTLIITNFDVTNVGFYAFIEGGKNPNAPKVLATSQVFQVLGLVSTNSGTDLTIWGAPLTSTGTLSANNCTDLQPCPGTYSRRVDFNWGWTFLSTTIPASVTDATTNRPLTKIRYWRSSPTAPFCGCSGSLNLPAPPSVSYVYTFTLYLPSSVTPGSQYPLVLTNMAAVPPQL